MKINQLFLLLILAISLFSCAQSDHRIKFKTLLERSGENRPTIQSIIDHYSKEPKDSLKFKAAVFLIQNLENRRYLDSKLLHKYMNYPELVLRDIDHGEYIMNSFNKLYGYYDEEDIEIKYDLQTITKDKMISQIDEAFVVWSSQPWGKNYDFNQFCNYILPFRIDNETPSYNRLEIYNLYNPLLDSIRTNDLDAVTACKKVNDELIKEGWIMSNRGEFLPHYQASSLIKNRIGSCRDMVDLGIFVMRSLGVPVTSDFLPQWPYRRQGHTWNVVFDEKGQAIPFLAAEDSPKTPHRPNTVKGKVYRNSFVINKSSLANIVSEDETIPDFLKNPYITDVTDEYGKVFNVPTALLNNQFKYAYLSVFNNVDWIPIAWSKVTDSSSLFTKVEGGAVYLPTFFDKSGIIPADEPFILNEHGVIQHLKADTSNKISNFECTRIYPIVAESYLTDNAKYGKIQAANLADFSDAVDLYTFNVRSLPGWNQISNNRTEKYQYFRFLSGSDKNCDIAEFQIFSSERKVDGRVYGKSNEEYTNLLNAIDNDTVSAYSSGKHSWIAIDARKKILVDKIRLMSRIEYRNEHGIVKNKKYKLSYWDKFGWRSVGEKVATGQSISFKNVPSNALYLLSNGDFKDQRIFTYKNGKQIWW